MAILKKELKGVGHWVCANKYLQKTNVPAEKLIQPSHGVRILFKICWYWITVDDKAKVILEISTFRCFPYFSSDMLHLGIFRNCLIEKSEAAGEREAGEDEKVVFNFI